VWPSCQQTSYSFLHDWLLDAVAAECPLVRHDSLVEATKITVAMPSAAGFLCSDNLVDWRILAYLHTFL
jgi:hypothetical protein